MSLARDRGVPTAHISARTHEDPGAAMVAALTGAGVSVVVLAGYMKLLDPRVVRAFPGRVLNIHPAPLPTFGGPGMYGLRVHEAVIASGVAQTGPTVHLVDEEYDKGEVLAFRPVSVDEADDAETLAQRVLDTEHDLLWRVLQERFADGSE